MHVKTDTKEKFTVITSQDSSITANMAGQLDELLLPYLEKETPHIVLNLASVEFLDPVCGEKLAAIQQLFYEQNRSFVICHLQETVEEMLDKAEILESMNVTPTESEAWDIVQMEEVERELLEGFDDE